MTTSEPTPEIVEEITNQSTTNDIIVVLKMIVQYLESFTMDKMSRDVMSAAADRLESQEEEKKISRYLIEMQSNVITELTARAEQAEKNCDIWEKKWWEEALKKVEAQAFKEKAERERDALKLEFATIEEDGLCSVCKFESSIPLLQCMEDCCFKHRGLSSLSVNGVSGDGNERRGLPQDGEGK